ncbi:MAG: hypothetical protein LBG63_00775 [Candidatus Methanoplasma sp.]|jgi:hypothetical protein|nr:hypothetical protein [Candidatus Methanoplasma sp.]
MDDTVTVEKLTLAIKNSIDKNDKNMEMEEEQAHMLARHVLNFFGYSDRIIDNILEPEDRDAFYMLEDAGLLTTEREETTLYDGREWRIHYWLFRRDRIVEMMESGPVRVSEEADSESAIYDELPDDIWRRSE